jgi:hypothetical protein
MNPILPHLRAHHIHHRAITQYRALEGLAVGEKGWVEVVFMIWVPGTLIERLRHPDHENRMFERVSD